VYEPLFWVPETMVVPALRAPGFPQRNCSETVPPVVGFHLIVNGCPAWILPETGTRGFAPLCAAAMALSAQTMSVLKMSILNIGL